MEQNNDMLLEQLNTFTRRKHTLDEVYLFDLILCDNEIDRDGDCFSDAALAELQKRFVGVTGIFDHNPTSANQTARIFRTELRTVPDRFTKNGKPYRCLAANAYMVRTDSNADLIREIDAGIKKEVSISCAAGARICSVCGANHLRKPCRHIKGRNYGGTPCYTTLDEISDVYEWSFVAVPAQRHAGVTKTLGGTACDAETVLLRDAYQDALSQLDLVSDFLRRDVIRLCYRWGENACAKALAESVIHMDPADLLKLRQSLMQSAEPLSVKPQLSAERNSGKASSMQAFSFANSTDRGNANE